MKTRILRVVAGKSRVVSDLLAVEEPLEIRVDNHPVSVTLRTPGDDEELAAGFLVSEGLIRCRSDLLNIKSHPRSGKGNVVNVFTAPDVKVDLKKLTRHVFASSSCGLCGLATIEAVRKNFSPVASKARVRAGILRGLPEKLKASQRIFAETGGLHAAALFAANGELQVLREDVGRHNAVDKVIGHQFLRGQWPAGDILLISGRASFEIMQKALAGCIPVVCAISAPSSLAVNFARRSGQTLVGFLRGDRMNVYAGRGRVVLE